MVIVMKESATEQHIQQAAQKLESMGFSVSRIVGVNHSILGAVGDKRGVDPRELEILEGVERVLVITEPYKLASRAVKPQGSRLRIGSMEIGGDDVVLMAGPCAVEGEAEIHEVAQVVARSGALVLRGGVPLYGDAALLASDAVGGALCEELDVCGVAKRACVAEDTTSTPIARTRSTVPASTRDTYGMAQRGEYSIVTRFTPARVRRSPASSASRPAYRSVVPGRCARVCDSMACTSLRGSPDAGTR